MQEASAPADGRGRRIVRGIGALTVQNLLSAALGFVLLASLVRFLSLNDYGAYASVQVSVGIAGAFAGFGLPAAVVRFLAPSSADEAGSGWGSAKAGLYLSLALAGTASIAMAAAAPFLSGYFLKGPSGAWVFYFGAAWLFTSSVSAPVQAVLQGLRRYVFLAKVLVASRVVAVSFAVAGLALYQSLEVAIASQVGYGILIIAAAIPAVLGPMRGADPGPHYSEVLRYALPLGLAGIVGVVAANADIVVVGGYLDTGSLAVYNATVQISSVLSAVFVSPLVTALFAETSLSSESREQVRQGTGLALRFSLVTLLPASFFAAAMAPQLFDLFSGGKVSYAAGIPYLELITLFFAFTAVQTISFTVLQGVSRTREVLIVGAIAAVGEVALSSSLVPSLGLAGAAYSRVAIFVVGCSLSLHFVREYLPRVDYPFYGKALVASALPALVVYVPSVLVSSRVITLIPYTALGVAVFVLCARGLRLVSPEDKAYIGHLLPRGVQWVLRLF